MKPQDIKEFELGEHCFGEILTVNGLEYEDLEQEEVLEFIIDMLKNNINSSSLIKDTLKNCLEYLNFDCIESDYYKCDHCGNWNTNEKYAPIRKV